MYEKQRSVSRSFEDEIDLVEVFHSLWKKKLLLIGFVFCFGLLGFLYADSTAQTFNTELRFRLITPEEILPPVSFQGLNDIDVSGEIVEDVFPLFVKNLTSPRSLIKFVEQRSRETFRNQDRLSYSELYGLVLDSLTSSINVKLNPDLSEVLVSYEHNEASDSVEFLLELYTWADQEVRQQLSEKLQYLVEQNIEIHLAHKKLMIVRDELIIEAKDRSAALFQSLAVSNDLIQQSSPNTFKKYGQALDLSERLEFEIMKAVDRELVTTIPRRDSLKSAGTIKAGLERLSRAKDDELIVAMISKISSTHVPNTVLISLEKKIVVGLFAVFGFLAAAIWVLLAKMFNP